MTTIGISHQNFDVEGDSGIVARTYGTCVLLERQRSPGSALSDSRDTEHAASLGAPEDPTLDNRLSSRFFTSESVVAAAATSARHRDQSQGDEVQLLTLRYFDPSVRVRIGGLVTARTSVHCPLKKCETHKRFC